MSRRIILITMSALMIFSVVGCAENEEGIETANQDGATAARIRALEDQIAQADSDRIADREHILNLQAELDRLRDQLANAQNSAPEGWSSGPGGAMTSIEGTFLFDSGEAKLRDGTESTLVGIAQTIRSQYGDHAVYVFGHTDDVPITHSEWTDNYQLSCERALTVARKLRELGVSTQVAACGWGQYRPLTTNDSEQARQANRRVEIYVISPEAMAGATARGN